MAIPFQSITESLYQQTQVNKWGSNFDIDTADAALGQVVWPVPATTQQYVFLDSAELAEIVSTSTDDSASGTGARTVKVYYQDSNGIEKSTTITLNGTTVVALPEKVLGVFRMKIASSGSGHTNAGDIKVLSQATGNILAIIKAGIGQTQIAVYRAPMDASYVIIRSHRLNYGRLGQRNDASARLIIRLNDGTFVTKWDPIIIPSDPEDEKIYRHGGIRLEPGEYVFWQVDYVGANATPIRGSFDVEVRH